MFVLLVLKPRCSEKRSIIYNVKCDLLDINEWLSVLCQGIYYMSFDSEIRIDAFIPSV